MRELFRIAPQDVLVINCRPRGAPWSDHSVYRLAQCLTWIAAYDSEDAHQSVEANAIPKPWVECGERMDRHPGPQAAQAPKVAVNCLHKPKFKERKAP